MDSGAFVDELERANEEILSRLRDSSPGPSAHADVRILLQIAMKNELEATELAAVWLPSTPELDVKIGLARQVGDEAKHFRLLESRFRELGGDENFDPLRDGHSPLFKYLTGLSTSVERLAAGQFTREALAQQRNEMFIEFLKEIGDEKTAALYVEIIQPDESYHHQLGRNMLLKYATSEASQRAARAACARTLEIAETLRAGAIAKTGVIQIPGC